MKRPFKTVLEPRIAPAAITYTPLGPYTAPQVVPTSRDDPTPAFIPQSAPSHVWDFAKNKMKESEEEAKMARVFRKAFDGVAPKNRAPMQGSKAEPLAFFDQITRIAKQHAKAQGGDLESRTGRAEFQRRNPGVATFDGDGKLTKFRGVEDRKAPPANEQDEIAEEGKKLQAQSGFGRRKKQQRGKGKAHICKKPYCICQYNRRRQ